MKTLRYLMVAFAVAAAVTFTAPAAGADPKGGDILNVHCDVLGTFQVVTFGNGKSSPGLVVDGKGVGIPYALRVEGSFTPTGEATQTFLEELSKPAPRNGRLDHCTWHEVSSDESGVFEVDGEVWISYTPNARAA